MSRGGRRLRDVYPPAHQYGRVPRDVFLETCSYGDTPPDIRAPNRTSNLDIDPLSQAGTDGRQKMYYQTKNDYELRGGQRRGTRVCGESLRYGPCLNCGDD